MLVQDRLDTDRESQVGRKGESMTVNDALRGVAGVFVIASVALGYFVSPWFFAFTAFVGLNLLQSAFTKACPMMSLLRKAGLPD